MSVAPQLSINDVNKEYEHENPSQRDTSVAARDLEEVGLQEITESVKSRQPIRVSIGVSPCTPSCLLVAPQLSTDDENKVHENEHALHQFSHAFQQVSIIESHDTSVAARDLEEVGLQEITESASMYEPITSSVGVSPCTPARRCNISTQVNMHLLLSLERCCIDKLM